MKTILIIATTIFPFLALADGKNEDDCYEKVIKVCPNKKLKPKPKAPVVVPEPPVCPACPKPKTIVVETVETITKLVPVPVPMPPVPCKHGLCPKEPPVVVGGRLALGLSALDPYTTGLVGLRLEFPKAYLGIDVFSQLQQGVGSQLLVYAYRGPVFKFHLIDLGFLITGSPFQLPNDKDIPRRVDLLLGMGIQVKLTCHLAFTADLRFDIPDPVKLANCPCDHGRRINAENAVGNAMAASQLYLGLLVHM